MTALVRLESCRISDSISLFFANSSPRSSNQSGNLGSHSNASRHGAQSCPPQVVSGDPSRVVIVRVPWTARRSNQSSLNEMNPEYSLEGPMLKLKLQYSGHLMRRTDSLEKTLLLGKIEDRRRRGDRG